MTRPAKSAPRLSRTDRRAGLLDAARAAFVTQGYHATAMDDIAELAGVSKPVLYQHFPGKLDLYLALLAESVDSLVAVVEDALAGTDDNKDRVHRAVEAYYGFVADNGQAYRLIFESDLRGEAAVEDLVDAATSRCIEAITQTITTDTGADAGRARLLASGLVGLSQVSARYWLGQDLPVSQPDAVELLSTLAWRGISRFPRQERPEHEGQTGR